MKSNIKVSIIIPTYNVEEWIGACLDSLVPLNHNGIEIILVNDGSTDKSREIAARYADKFEHFKIHDQVNMGPSEARNTGLRLATGDYIYLMDSDDYIDPVAFEEFMNEAIRLGVDIAVGNGQHLEGNEVTGPMNSTNHIKALGVTNGADYYLAASSHDEFRVYVPINLYRRNFLVSENLTFQIAVNHEDEEFAPMVFALAKKVVYLDKYFYFYRHRIGSFTKSVNHKYINPKSVPSFLKIIEALGSFKIQRQLNPSQVKVMIHAVHKCVLEVLRRELYYVKNAVTDLSLTTEHWENLKNSLKDVKFSPSQKLTILRIKSKIFMAKLLHA